MNMKKEEKEKKQIERFAKLNRIENELRLGGAEYIAGVDEVGRGPLAGPVYAAAVILPSDFDVLGIDDSKKITEKNRIRLDKEIREKAVAIGIASADNEEIDDLNILEATKLAMKRAVEKAEIMLKERVCVAATIDMLLIDALSLPDIDIPQKSIIHGDASSISIAAASIAAKVARDKFMTDMDKAYPGYSFASNKGYGTAAHYEGINNIGISPIHRRTFLKNYETKHKNGEWKSSEVKAGTAVTRKTDKIYAVKNGRTTGIFENWEECKESVNGYPNAEYKGFSDINDAWDYLGLSGAKNLTEELEGSDVKPDVANDTVAKAYVDGSYDVEGNRFSCGAVILTGDREIKIKNSYADKDAARLRNVAGEIMGARIAIEHALDMKIKKLLIYYDYSGIGAWGDDKWKANLDMTKEYKKFVKEARKKMQIVFVKVRGHSGDKYNDMADKLAKEALEMNG